MPYSVRMRAAEGGPHEEGGRHISGAERIVETNEMDHTVTDMVQRALHHEKGHADAIRISIDAIAQESIQYIEALHIHTFENPGQTEAEKRAAATAECESFLEAVGVSPLAISKGMEEMAKVQGNLRGALLIDATTGERLDQTGNRGVRVSHMDMAEENRFLATLAQDGLTNVHVREALVLASKVLSAPGIIAEWCCSDDPHYTTGYVSGNGVYHRVWPMKEMGSPVGGRIFFVRPSESPYSLADTISYLESTPVLVRPPQRADDINSVDEEKEKVPSKPVTTDTKGVTAKHLAPSLATFAQELASLQEKDQYRKPKLYIPVSATEVCVPDDPSGRRYIQLSSNNYLSLTHHPKVLAAAKDALERYGTSSTGSRLTSGTHPATEQLEKALQAFKGTDGALVFNTGYMANVGVISGLAGKGDVIISDALNHASIIDGIRMSKADVLVYPHRDLVALEECLQKARNHGGHVFAVTDTVFSMDGTIAPLHAMNELCLRYGAFLIMDDAHATGVIGDGRGGAHYAGIAGHHLIQVGTLSKALASEGGFVCANETIISYLVNKSRPFIFSTALAPATMAAAEAAIHVIESDGNLVKQLDHHWRYVVRECAQRGLTITTETPILPIIGHTNEEALRMQRELYEKGMIGMAIRPPTVPEGTSRLRLTVTAGLTQTQLEHLVQSLCEIANLS